MCTKELKKYKKDIVKLYPLLKILQKLSDVERQVVICYLTNDGCDGIYDCIVNVMTNKSIPKQQRKKLRQDLQEHKHHLQCLLRKNQCQKRNYKSLRKIGGNVGVVLDTALPALEKFMLKEKLLKQ